MPTNPAARFIGHLQPETYLAVEKKLKELLDKCLLMDVHVAKRDKNVGIITYETEEDMNVYNMTLVIDMDFIRDLVEKDPGYKAPR